MQHDELIARKNAQHPDAGDAIRGSRFVRDYCAQCHDPIRVKTHNALNYCHECDVVPDRQMCPGGDSPEAHDRRYHGGRFHSAEW